MPPYRKYATENVPIFATQCSKPAATNAIITQNITTSLPLSDFILVPVKTAIQTKKLHNTPLKKACIGTMLSLEVIKLFIIIY